MCLIAINFIWPFNRKNPYVGKFAEWIRLENWNSFARLFSVFYARKNSTEMCVTDFWTVVFVLFRYKSSRVKLEEYEISSRTQLTFEERESERKLDKEKEEEIEEYIWSITRKKRLHVSAASAEHSLSFGRVQPLSKNVPWFCRFCKRHLTAIDQPATTFTEMAYTKSI